MELIFSFRQNLRHRLIAEPVYSRKESILSFFKKTVVLKLTKLESRVYSHFRPKQETFLLSKQLFGCLMMFSDDLIPLRFLNFYLRNNYFLRAEVLRWLFFLNGAPLRLHVCAVLFRDDYTRVATRSGA